MKYKSIRNVDATRLYRVYCVHPKNDFDIDKYYIGITKNSLSFRLLQHSTSKRPVGTHIRALGLDNVTITELYTLPFEDARKKEAELRPRMFMGWNYMAGGCVVTSVCTSCGTQLLSKGRGYQCIKCNDTRFKEGIKPHNYGKGVQACIIAPNGTKHYPTSLVDFCKEYGLITANMRKVLKGGRKHTKGYTGYKL